MKKTFYISTPIYYPSDNLHIGHAYTTTLADVLSRYKKKLGYETFFVTGSDEHGEKIAEKAASQNVEPIDFTNEKVDGFKNLWKKIGIDYDKFIRTTSSEHQISLQKIMIKLKDNSFIYKDKYFGDYCLSCEEFLTLAQFTKIGTCQICGRTPKKISEETYFLIVSKFKNFLEKIFNNKEEIIYPSSTKKEMLNNFVRNDLKDLSITRTSFSWGVPLSFDPKHIIYVWIDALCNYLTSLNYLRSNDDLFQKFWGEDTEIVQYVGKEISRFHTIYWPVILNCLGLRMPNKIINHGWILFKDHKMSKSQGNTVSPIDIINSFDRDSLRMFLVAEFPIERDGKYSDEIFLEFYNKNLANNIGNLFSRISNMAIKYFNGKIKISKIDPAVMDEINVLFTEYNNLMNKYDLYTAHKKVLHFGEKINKYIEEKSPWKLHKENKINDLETIIDTCLYSVILIFQLLSPTIIDGSEKAFKMLGNPHLSKNLNELIKPKDIGEINIQKLEIIYPRK